MSVPALPRRRFLISAASAIALVVARSYSAAAVAAPAPATLLANLVSPPTCYIPDNPAAHEYREQFNLSCEVASFKIVLLHYNLAAVTEELLQDILGVNENPTLGFRGDYRALSTNGLQNYGAHAPALQKLIARFPYPGTFNPIPVANLDDARAAISRNWLVMAWIPVGLQPSYSASIKMSTGDTAILVPGEHVIVLHGYDGGGFYPYDPRPSPRVPGYIPNAQLARAMGLFPQPGLAIQPLF